MQWYAVAVLHGLLASGSFWSRAAACVVYCRALLLSAKRSVVFFFPPPNFYYTMTMLGKRHILSLVVSVEGTYQNPVSSLMLVHLSSPFWAVWSCKYAPCTEVSVVGDYNGTYCMFISDLSRDTLILVESLIRQWHKDIDLAWFEQATGISPWFGSVGRGIPPKPPLEMLGVVRYARETSFLYSTIFGTFGSLIQREVENGGFF